MSLAQHNTRILFWSNLFGSVSFLAPLLTLFYAHRGLTETEIIFSLTAFSATMLLFEVPTGAFADRYGPKASFLVGSAVRILSWLVLIWAWAPWMVWLSKSLLGLSWTFFSGAEEALVYESLKEEGQEGSLDAVLGKIGSGTFAAALLTQIVGALVAKDLREEQFVLLLAATTACTLVQLLLLTRIREPRSISAFRDNPLAHVREGLATLRRTPDLVKLFANLSIIFICSYVFWTFDQPYLTGAGLPVSWLGLVYGAYALLGLLVSRNIGRLTARFSRVGLMYGTALLTLAAIAVAALVQNSVAVGLTALLVSKLANAIRQPVAAQLQNEYIPSGSRATTLSLLSVLDSVFDVLIVVPLATATAPFGRPVIFAGCAVIVAMALMIRVRRAQQPATEAVG